MRLICLAIALALPWLAVAAPTWQVISSEPGKRIELDRTSIKHGEAGKVTALARIILEKGVTDTHSGATYRVIEALTQYDCAGRNAATVKRIYKKDADEALREEELKGGLLPVRTGTLDDKVLREVCRPANTRAEALETAAKASQAADKLRAANAALLQKEVARAKPIKTSDAHAAPPASADAGRARKPSHARAVAKQESHGAAAHVHWAYEGEGGPENWHRLDPKNHACASGQRQSPIDIRDGIPVDLEPIRFDYRPASFGIIDNGHTVQVSINAGALTITGKTYELVQFHFHRPSEEKVNGKRYDMVAHLVHKSEEGKLAVVAVLLEKGADNPVIQTLWNNLPLERNVLVLPPAVTIDLNAFLPAMKTYYTFMGSLTTPPCTEGVLWLVLKQPVSLSAEQLSIFSRLYRNNARPVQQSHDRLIKESR